VQWNDGKNDISTQQNLGEQSGNWNGVTQSLMSRMEVPKFSGA